MQTVWILNHYASTHFINRGGRHYWLSRRLRERGHTVTVFAASVVHGRGQLNETAMDAELDGVNFRFIRTPVYSSIPARVVNMLAYYRGVLTRAKKSGDDLPDIIYASSAHPLTLLAGIQLSRRFGIPCVCEVRDLWPLSIEVYFSFLRNRFPMKLLYAAEKWLYKRSDQLVFTMEGGEQYLSQKGWLGTIGEENVHHINNGVDLESFDTLSRSMEYRDPDLDDEDVFKIVYAGSIRRVNAVSTLVEIARELDRRDQRSARLLIFGDGDERARLQAQSKDLSNIVFKGRVGKASIPYVLSKADALILHGEQGQLTDYGPSMNKLFEYMASAKPILSDCHYGYDPVVRADCGVVVPEGDSVQMADAIEYLMALPPEDYAAIGRRARAAATEYDFRVLAEKLLNVFSRAHIRHSHHTE